MNRAVAVGTTAGWARTLTVDTLPTRGVVIGTGVGGTTRSRVAQKSHSSTKRPSVSSVQSGPSAAWTSAAWQDDSA